MSQPTETPNVGDAGAAPSTSLLGTASTVQTPEGAAAQTPPAPTAEASTAQEAEPVYEFKAPEGESFDAEVLGAYTEVVRELKLPVDAAQKVLDKVAPVLHARALAQQAEAARAQREAVVKATQEDPEIGGAKLEATLAQAQKTLALVATPDLVKYLNESGAGNHPAVIKAFAKLAGLMSPDRFVPSTQGNGASRDLAGRLFND